MHSTFQMTRKRITAKNKNIPIRTASHQHIENPEAITQNPDFVRLKIPFFHGPQLEDIVQHLRRFDVERAAYNWNEATAKRVLTYFLGDSAGDWFEIQQDALDNLDWAQIKEAFKARIKPSVDNNKLVIDFCGFKNTTFRYLNFFRYLNNYLNIKLCRT